MKTQDILARVNGALAQCTPENVPFSLNHELKQLAADLEAQVRREIAASKGVGSAARIITAMLKGPRIAARRSLTRGLTRRAVSAYATASRHTGCGIIFRWLSGPTTPGRRLT